MIVILVSEPIDIPNPKKCRVNHGLSAEIPFEQIDLAKKTNGEVDKNEHKNLVDQQKSRVC